MIIEDKEFSRKQWAEQSDGVTDHFNTQHLPHVYSTCQLGHI